MIFQPIPLTTSARIERMLVNFAKKNNFISIKRQKVKPKEKKNHHQAKSDNQCKLEKSCKTSIALPSSRGDKHSYEISNWKGSTNGAGLARTVTSFKLTALMVTQRRVQLQISRIGEKSLVQNPRNWTLSEKRSRKFVEHSTLYTEAAKLWFGGKIFRPANGQPRKASRGTKIKSYYSAYSAGVGIQKSFHLPTDLKTKQK